jgi:hypothetical protein
MTKYLKPPFSVIENNFQTSSNFAIAKRNFFDLIMRFMNLRYVPKSNKVIMAKLL